MFYHKPCSLQTLGAARRGLNLPALFSRLFSRVCADPSSYSFSHIQEHSLCVPKHASWWVERVSFTLMPGPPIVNTFLKTFGMTGTPQREPRFAEVLDRDDEPVENGDGQSEAGHQGNIQLQHQYYGKAKIAVSFARKGTKTSLRNNSETVGAQQTDRYPTLLYCEEVIRYCAGHYLVLK